jgi:hypothetical protein
MALNSVIARYGLVEGPPRVPISRYNEMCKRREEQVPSRTLECLYTGGTQELEQYSYTPPRTSEPICGPGRQMRSKQYLSTMNVYKNVSTAMNIPDGKTAA